MRSRFLNELTTVEVKDYLAGGGSLAILPLGSVEMHGPHLPMGTDSLIAKAGALLLAQRANGLVLPEVHYTWCGATDGFAGTVSVEPELSQKTVEAIACKVFKMGFKRLVLVNAHYPNNPVFYTTARRLYETNSPVLLTDITLPYTDEARHMQPDETALLLAALRILGMEGLYPEEDMLRDDPAPPLNESYRKLARVGTVSYHFQDARQHAAPSASTSAKQGLEYLMMQVEALAPLMDDLDKYIDAVKGLENQGTWR